MFYSILEKKRDGGELTSSEIEEFVHLSVSGGIADYQVSAWLMAAFLRGLSDAETLALTLAMRDSGEKVDLSDLGGSVLPLDKHSTGGVGDKTTLILVPLLAAAGIPMLKMSGRGLGHTGGTIDKLDAIPGFRSELTIDEAKAQVRKIGAAIVAQSGALVPADRLFYSLRDATATVESASLIASSIMSKKLAAGSARILLDVKVGRGAFMPTVETAQHLAEMMIRIGDGAGVPTEAVLTDMNSPLGRGIGNSLEVIEALDVLSGKSQGRLTQLCLQLAAHALHSSGLCASDEEGAELASRLLTSGAGLTKFLEISAAQGGPESLDTLRSVLPAAPATIAVSSASAGYICDIDSKQLGLLAMRLGAGRQRKEDKIDLAAGIWIEAHVGESVDKGQTLATLHLSEAKKAEADRWIDECRSAFQVRTEKQQEGPLILMTLPRGSSRKEVEE